MAVRGRIECRFTPGSLASTDFFVTFHNFLLGLPGVTRIACSFGSGGTGIDYRDATTTIGTNAFAVFRFGNALVPFYVLIQCVNTTAGGTSIQSPGSVSVSPTGTINAFGVLIAIAQRLDGNSPWAGSTVNNGTDTKSTPVWSPGPSAASYWPRNNASGGAFATNREGLMYINMVGIGSAADSFNDIFTNGARVHFLADDDNLMILQDVIANGTYNFFYFGRYTPRPGITVQAPYVCLSAVDGTNDPILKQYNWGAITQISNLNVTTLGEGGIAHPVVSTGTRICFTDFPAGLLSTTYQPNRATSSPGRYDLLPIYVGLNEAPSYGLLGSINFFRMSYNMPPTYLSPDRRFAAFGNGGVNSGKLVVPWDGATAPGSGNTRQGISF